MFKLLRQDLALYAHGEKLRDKIKVLLISPGFYAVVLIRLQSFLYFHRRIYLAYLVNRINLNLHGIDVLPGAHIGGGLRIEHPVGIVIGAGCVIGENCTIMQGVTLGVRNVIREFNTHKYPVVGSNVFIGPNSTLLGDIIIGDNVTISAHSLVLISCPKKSKYSRNGLSSLNNMGDSLGDFK